MADTSKELEIEQVQSVDRIERLPTIEVDNYRGITVQAGLVYVV